MHSHPCDVRCKKQEARHNYGGGCMMGAAEPNCDMHSAQCAVTFERYLTNWSTWDGLR
jgi:hypothetical protein